MALTSYMDRIIEWQEARHLNHSAEQIRVWFDSRPTLRGADLRNAAVHSAREVGVGLTDADLARAGLAWSDLTRAKLGPVGLAGATLARAPLEGATLEGAPEV